MSSKKLSVRHQLQFCIILYRNVRPVTSPPLGSVHVAMEPLQAPDKIEIIVNTTYAIPYASEILKDFSRDYSFRDTTGLRLALVSFSSITRTSIATTQIQFKSRYCLQYKPLIGFDRWHRTDIQLLWNCHVLFACLIF